jgi:hypothetical protein
MIPLASRTKPITRLCAYVHGLGACNVARAWIRLQIGRRGRLTHGDIAALSCASRSSAHASHSSFADQPYYRPTGGAPHVRLCLQRFLTSTMQETDTKSFEIVSMFEAPLYTPGAAVPPIQPAFLSNSSIQTGLHTSTALALSYAAPLQHVAIGSTAGNSATAASCPMYSGERLPVLDDDTIVDGEQHMHGGGPSVTCNNSTEQGASKARIMNLLRAKIVPGGDVLNADQTMAGGLRHRVWPRRA